MNALELEYTIDTLARSPILLNGLVEKVPNDKLKIRRIKNKWCIHEHVCHLAVTQPMLYDRLMRFRDEDAPEFKPYLPGVNVKDDDLIDMNMDQCLLDFEYQRRKLIDLIKDFDKDVWDKEGTHPEYELYTPAIIVRHIMMHDHLHMYRIEELWLTTESYLRKD